MKKGLWRGWAAWVCVLLAGCETTGPQVREDAPPGVLACSVGPSGQAHTVRLEVWRGRESGLSKYGVAQVCRRLDEVSRGLQAQGAAVRFEVSGTVQVHPDLGPANNTRMQQAVTALDGLVRLVIVDAIDVCGGTVGYILGCTPQIGRPLVYVKSHDMLNDVAPEWVIWAHELGHTVALPHPDNGFSGRTYPERIMTYMPQPQSSSLVEPEPTRFGGLGSSVNGSGGGGAGASGAAVGAPETDRPVAAQDLVAFILKAGQHGVPLQALAHLDDDALLNLRAVLEPSAAIGNPWLSRISQAVRINALVPLAELGRDKAQAYVRDYLQSQKGEANQNLRRYGLWALGRGQLRHPTEDTRIFLQRATQVGFWCADEATKAADCIASAQAAQEAQEDLRQNGKVPGALR